jgi:hypothetical protein
LKSKQGAAVHDGVPRYMTAIFDQGARRVCRTFHLIACWMLERERMQVRVIATLSLATLVVL